MEFVALEPIHGFKINSRMLGHKGHVAISRRRCQIGPPASIHRTVLVFHVWRPTANAGTAFAQRLGFDVSVVSYISDIYIPVEPHEAVPEVSKGKVHITQNKHVPIEWFVTTASQSRI